MKKLYLLISVVVCLNCNQSDSNSSKSSSDTLTRDLFKELDSLIPKESEKITIIKRKTDTTLLLKTAVEILRTIKIRDYNKFASFIQPEYGVRFSPYAYIDTTESQVLSVDQIIQLSKQKNKINWGSAWDPDMDPELFTIDEYFKKYVYDVDFLNADLKSINEFHTQGTDLNNIEEVYPNCDIVEFYFPGFEEKYGGHDFRGLRLVFQFHNDKPYLVAIVHDEWTP